MIKKIAIGNCYFLLIISGPDLANNFVKPFARSRPKSFGTIIAWYIGKRLIRTLKNPSQKTGVFWQRALTPNGARA